LINKSVDRNQCIFLSIRIGQGHFVRVVLHYQLLKSDQKKRTIMKKMIIIVGGGFQMENLSGEVASNNNKPL